MKFDFDAIVKRHQQELAPQPTETNAELRPIAGIRAVLFDVYGTMLISGCGEVGTVAAPPDAAIQAAFTEVACELQCEPDQLARQLVASIQAAQQAAKENGAPYPEVDIVEVWKQVIAAAVENHWLPATAVDLDAQRIAVEYEMRANPVAAMPALLSTLKTMSERGLRLGVISNAQFFTLPLFPPIVGASLIDLGFDSELFFLSYQHLRAKPGLELFRLAQNSLQYQGISPGEVLYIGNDMLNDVAPAAEIGFRTALFAGDARSLRLREGDSRVKGVRPDIVVTCLDQLITCLGT